jgi:hypothetical protein
MTGHPPAHNREPAHLNAAALRASVSARVERLRAGVATAGLTDPTEALTAAGLPVPVGTPAPAGTAKFLARADSFLAAIEIALPLQVAREKGHHLRQTLNHLVQLVEFIGSGMAHTLRELGYLEDSFLTYWNEGPDSETHAFWEQVRVQGLPYQRVGHLGKILARGRIASRTEYEFAVDSVVIAEQDGRLTPADATLLAQLIEAYETRRR